jgi:hypothetical protein
MILETHNNLNQPQRIEATRFVVRDKHGTPVMVALQMTDEQIWCCHCGEEGFQRALQAMGINETVITKVVGKDAAGPLPSGAIELPHA